MKINLIRYLSAVYFVSQPLHVSGIFVAHHQEVYCIYTTIGTCCAFQLFCAALLHLVGQLLIYNGKYSSRIFSVGSVEYRNDDRSKGPSLRLM